MNYLVFGDVWMGFGIHGDASLFWISVCHFTCDCYEDYINVLGCILLGDSGFICHSFLLNCR
jgi:hypothetical protein